MGNEIQAVSATYEGATPALRQASSGFIRIGCRLRASFGGTD